MNRLTLSSLHRWLGTRLFDRVQDPALLFTRVTMGWLFFLTGKGKLGHLADTTEFFASLGLPLPGFHAVAIGALECVGGLLLLAGFGTRLVAMLLTGSMTVAYLTAHTGDFGGISAFADAAPFRFLLAALVLTAFGAGRWSLDALFTKNTRATGTAAGQLAEMRA